jgi:chromosome partitioning protein
MKGLVISNQRGGVGKTTTAINLSGYLVKRGKRVLLIDADSQGSIGTYFNLYPEKKLYHLIVSKEPLAQCAVPVVDGLDVICSDRDTHQAEAALLGQTAREMALKLLLKQAEGKYDYVIIDVAPSITLLQTCAMMFAQNVLIPVDMDMLSLQGAQAAFETANMLHEYYGTAIDVIGLLPTQIDRRNKVTDVVSTALEVLSRKTGVPILPEIRTDQTVHKAARLRQFLFDYDPASKAATDYLRAFDVITKTLEGVNGQAQTA